MDRIQLNGIWKVLQDVHDSGEKNQIYQPGWNPTDSFLHCISDWQDIDRLEHLQILLAKNPYYGRELRYFNAAPWWYKKEFLVPESNRNDSAVLRFDGVDYFCRVWLNGTFLGSHEGYFSSFEFDVSGLLRYDAPNLVIVKVWSPFDDEQVAMKQMGMDISFMFRFLTSQKNMIKGTYDHADGFLQRDINPVGIFAGVCIDFYKNIRFCGEPVIKTLLDSNRESAEVDLQIPLYAAGSTEIVCKYTIADEETGSIKCKYEIINIVQEGYSQLSMKAGVREPKIWNSWDRGGAWLYSVRVDLFIGNEKVDSLYRRFGIREIEIIRDVEQTAFVLNREKIYLRGASYFPEAYLSRMSRERYERDLLAMKDAGFNAVRVHVHVARPEFYELCDEIGMLVIQDSDLTWFHPMTEEFTKRAVGVFSDMVRMLRNHPSIICWICLNEPDLWKLAQERGQISLEENPGSMMEECPGPQLVDALKILDPTRPYIKGSHFKDDPESGDEHDYTGSLRGEETHYTDIYGRRYKFTTEFGFDAPAIKENLVHFKELYERIKPVLDDEQGLEELHYYRYRYFKYVMEYHRIIKYRPCSGYFQFLFSDVVPQSFYGIYDWWGTPKKYIKAFYESNQPSGIFMEHKEGPVAIWAVNDLSYGFGECTAEWYVSDNAANEIISDSCKFNFDKDSLVKISDLSFEVKKSVAYQVALIIRDSSGRVVARNHYDNAFQHPEHPKGHPMRLDQELGIRLYWA